MQRGEVFPSSQTHECRGPPRPHPNSCLSTLSFLCQPPARTLGLSLACFFWGGPVAGRRVALQAAPSNRSQSCPSRSYRRAFPDSLRACSMCPGCRASPAASPRFGLAPRSPSARGLRAPRAPPRFVPGTRISASVHLATCLRNKTAPPARVRPRGSNDADRKLEVARELFSDDHKVIEFEVLPLRPGGIFARAPPAGVTAHAFYISGLCSLLRPLFLDLPSSAPPPGVTAMVAGWTPSASTAGSQRHGPRPKGIVFLSLNVARYATTLRVHAMGAS